MRPLHASMIVASLATAALACSASGATSKPDDGQPVSPSDATNGHHVSGTPQYADGGFDDPIDGTGKGGGDPPPDGAAPGPTADAGAPLPLGWYCGRDPELRAAFAGVTNLVPDDLYKVIAGASSPVDQGSCANGCAPGGPHVADYCKYSVDGGGANAPGRCWAGAGDYCGYDLGIAYSGSADDLFTCDAFGGITLTRPCANGCATNPRGSDTCR